jgi:redox-sensitive bicupin YhaK (pirin superfamily)
VTYLFRGEITHKDSLGTDLPIRPGEVNWMTAGKGIAHSERTPPDHRDGHEELFGIQAWVALPRVDEERDPDFSHHEKAALPLISGEGKDIRLIAGSLYGESSPVPTFSDMFYADCALEPGAALPLEAEHEERGLYLVDGTLEIAGALRGRPAPGFPPW